MDILFQDMLSQELICHKIFRGLYFLPFIFKIASVSVSALKIAFPQCFSLTVIFKITFWSVFFKNMNTAMSLEDLESEIKAIYKQLEGKEFKGLIHERKTSAVCTGGPRDVINVYDAEVEGIMDSITSKIEQLSKKFEPESNDEMVWKSITMNPEPRLWVTSYHGDDDTELFTVKSIEVKTGLNWQKSYKAMVNIKLE